MSVRVDRKIGTEDHHLASDQEAHRVMTNGDPEGL